MRLWDYGTLVSAMLARVFVRLPLLRVFDERDDVIARCASRVFAWTEWNVPFAHFSHARAAVCTSVAGLLSLCDLIDACVPLQAMCFSLQTFLNG